MRPCSAKWLDLPEAHFLNCKWVVNCGQDWVWSTWNIVGSQFMSTLLHSGDPRMASPGLQCCNCSAIASNCIQFTGYHSKQTFQATWLWCDPTRCHLPESNRVGKAWAWPRWEMNTFPAGSVCLFLQCQQIPAYGSLERSQSVYVLRLPFQFLKKKKPPPK